MASTAPCLAVMLIAALVPSCLATRPSPAAAATVLQAQDGFLPSHTQQQQQQHYNRRALLRQQDGEAAAELSRADAADAAHQAAAEAAEAAMVALTWGYQLEQQLIQLEQRGAVLAPQVQQEREVAALVARGQALAASVIAATRADIAALGAQLVAGLPSSTSAAAMATLLQSSEFHLKLKAAVDEATLLVAAALEPAAGGVAAAVHAALARLVAGGDAAALQPLPAFSEAYLHAFSSSFSLNVVEATLLRTLWQDS